MKHRGAHDRGEKQRGCWWEQRGAHGRGGKQRAGQSVAEAAADANAASEAKGGNEALTAEEAKGSTEVPTAEEKSNEAGGGIIGAPTAEEGSNERAKTVAQVSNRWCRLSNKVVSNYQTRLGMVFGAAKHESALSSPESDLCGGSREIKVVCIDQAENNQSPWWLGNSR